MIDERVRNVLQIEYEKRILIFDQEDFASCFDYTLLLRANEYDVYLYDDIERIRYVYETQIKNSSNPCAIIVRPDFYVPTDIRDAFYEVNLSLKTVYPNMDSSALKKHIHDIDLIDYSYDFFERDCLRESSTEYYIAKSSFSKENIQDYLATKEKYITQIIDNVASFDDWIDIAILNAKLERYSCIHNITRNQDFIDTEFKNFVMDGYQKLHGTSSQKAPVVLPKVMDRIANEENVALIVADGMSMFDFEILSNYLGDFEYSLGGSYALIPTTTSISRQSLLSGKYPQQIENPFSLAKEEKVFYEAAMERGYLKEQCFYGRGYEELPNYATRIATIIINDIDDMVHGQKQGRIGMYNDVMLWAEEGKIQALINTLLDKGFKVYLTSDHGNTTCVGDGNIKKLGVETATKSKRMVVLKDFADVSEILQERTFEYPGYYLDKNYHYLICKGRSSFDNKDEKVMTHGGVTLEEVIVPFVEVRRK